jgi:hypothetical protein
MQLTLNVVKQFKLVNYWYLAALENIKDEDGSKVVPGTTNSLEWLAGHLLTGRYRNLVRLGVQLEPYGHLDKFVNQSIPPPNAIAFDSHIEYPLLSESSKQWRIYSDILLQSLTNIDENKLKSEISFTIPIGGNTIEDTELFATLHETYHIGQMSIVRKSLGYSPMQLFQKR